MSSTSRSKNNRKHIAVEYEDNESVGNVKFYFKYLKYALFANFIIVKFL